MYHTCSHANVGKIIATMGCIMGRIMTKNGGEITTTKIGNKGGSYMGDSVWRNKGQKFYIFLEFFFNWNSPCARLNSHYEAWNYKKNKHKNVKAYRKSL